MSTETTRQIMEPSAILYREPDKRSAVIATLPVGTNVVIQKTLSAPTGYWLEVAAGGATGFLRGDTRLSSQQERSEESALFDAIRRLAFTPVSFLVGYLSIRFLDMSDAIASPLAVCFVLTFAPAVARAFHMSLISMTPFLGFVLYLTMTQGFNGKVFTPDGAVLLLLVTAGVSLFVYDCLAPDLLSLFRKDLNATDRRRLMPRSFALFTVAAIGIYANRERVNDNGISVMVISGLAIAALTAPDHSTKRE